MDNRPEPQPHAIGQRIRRRRQALGLTQAQLGRKLGVSYTLVSAYEHGRQAPNAQRLERIEYALKFKISDI